MFAHVCMSMKKNVRKTISVFNGVPEGNVNEEK